MPNSADIWLRYFNAMLQLNGETFTRKQIDINMVAAVFIKKIQKNERADWEAACFSNTIEAIIPTAALKLGSIGVLPTGIKEKPKETNSLDTFDDISDQLPKAEPEKPKTKPYSRSFFAKAQKALPPPKPLGELTERSEYRFVAKSRLAIPPPPRSQPVAQVEVQRIPVVPDNRAEDIELDFTKKPRKLTVPPGAPPLENLDSSHLSDDKFPAALKSWLTK